MVVSSVVASLVVLLVGAGEIELVRDVAAIPSSLPRPILPSPAEFAGLLVPAPWLNFVGLIQGAGITQSVPEPDGRMGRAVPGREMASPGRAPGQATILITLRDEGAY